MFKLYWTRPKDVLWERYHCYLFCFATRKWKCVLMETHCHVLRRVGACPQVGRSGTLLKGHRHVIWDVFLCVRAKFWHRPIIPFLPWESIDNEWQKEKARGTCRRTTWRKGGWRKSPYLQEASCWRCVSHLFANERKHPISCKPAPGKLVAYTRNSTDHKRFMTEIYETENNTRYRN